MKAAQSPLRALRGQTWICQSCVQKRAMQGLSVRAKYDKLKREDRRFKYGEKLDKADDEWATIAKEIEEGRKDSMLTFLRKRGFVNAVTGEPGELDQLLTKKRIGVYSGIDPTAPSLHVGHLVPLMVLVWFWAHGYPAVTLLGGGTAQIGDPTDRLKSRETTPRAERVANMANMHAQLKKLWDNVELHADRQYGYSTHWAGQRALVNNNAWWSKNTALEFLKYLGTGLRIGPLLSRDTVKNRMKRDEGMSFAEFSYPLMQAWDWWQLFDQRDVQLQIGGSDQYGNIITGIEGVEHVANQRLDPIEKTKFGPLAKRFGLTIPLITTASGEKFGKSAGNAVWLDPELTPIFEQYQFFLRTPDADVGHYLRLFTLIPLSEIESLLESHKSQPKDRIPQKRLAYEVMSLVHGRIEADKVLDSHEMLFKKGSSSPPRPSHRVSYAKTKDDINPQTNKNAAQTNSEVNYPHNVTLPRSFVMQQSSSRILYAAGLVRSASEGERLIQARGAYVGQQKGKNPKLDGELKWLALTSSAKGDVGKMVVDESLLLLRAGKWNIKIARIIGDEEFDARGLDVPGWKEFRDYKREPGQRTEDDGDKQAAVGA